uniref:acetyl-CoA C-acetyltransferase n=1 Tax=Thermogemmatispora argillosa TaxID=2045280 RepID=A0A455T153_9CHLR|nr:hypothetical protein KTA_03540 [Thermogemmatispora argillosa]
MPGLWPSPGEKGLYATGNLLAARQALTAAGVSLRELRAVKTHNPFAVNDIYFARELGLALESFNHYGSPLVFSHPQGPTGLRQIIELIEELIMPGGGCTAGDTGTAIVVHVDLH